MTDKLTEWRRGQITNLVAENAVLVSKLAALEAEMQTMLEGKA